MEGSGLTGDPLNQEACVFINKNGHGFSEGLRFRQ